MGTYIIKEYISEIVQIGVSIGVGCLTGFLAVYIFNHLPAHWLCEPEEEPRAELYEKRLKENPWIIIFSVFFVGVTLRLVTVYLAPYTPLDYLQMLLSLATIWILLQIGIADRKYSVIPDQYILAIAIIALFLEHSIIGAVLGAGVFVALGLIGKFLLKREDLMSYGNLKLAAAIGFGVGAGYLGLILVGTTLVSMLYFIGMYLYKKKTIFDTQLIGQFMVFFAIIILLS